MPAGKGEDFFPPQHILVDISNSRQKYEISPNGFTRFMTGQHKVVQKGKKIIKKSFFFYLQIKLVYDTTTLPRERLNFIFMKHGQI